MTEPQSTIKLSKEVQDYLRKIKDRRGGVSYDFIIRELIRYGIKHQKECQN